MSRPHFIGGALLAALAAGPLFVLKTYYGFAVTLRNLEWRLLESLPLVLLVAAAFGFVIALVPSVAASGVLVWLGRRHAIARHPLVWAAAGLAIGCAIGLIFVLAGGALPGWLGWSSMILSFGWPGGACALIARCCTRWPEGLSYKTLSR